MINAEALRVKPTLRGERLTLVPLAPEHAEQLHATLGDPELRRLTGTHREFTRTDIDQWCASRAEQPDRVDLAVTDRHTGAYLGELALIDVDPDNGSASYRIALTAAGSLGRGYGTEATMLVLDYAFTEVGLHRVQLEVFEYNTRAIAAYTKCGFVHEGTMRQALRWDGRWHDVLLMAALAGEGKPAGGDKGRADSIDTRQ